MGVARSPAPRPTQVGVGPRWTPFGSQGAMEGMAGSMAWAWTQGRMGEGRGERGPGVVLASFLPPSRVQQHSVLGAHRTEAKGLGDPGWGTSGPPRILGGR